jgi:hypothetical protein
MMALRAHTQGGPEVLVYESAPRPTPGNDEVLIAVHAAAITFAELTWPETWASGGVDRTPVIPSHEFSGVVAEVGDGVTGLSTGDEVYGLVPFDRDGAAAEYVSVPEPAVQEEQEDRPVADVGDREEPPHRIVADRLDELVVDTRLAERPQRRGLGEFLGRQPVAEHLERPDVAGDADRRERRAELEDPRPQFRPGELLDRAILAQSANRPAEDHPVPLEGLGRGALGGLPREEQIDRPAECQVPARIRCPSIRGRRIRCPKIRGIRCPNHVRRLLRRTAGRCSGTICWPLVGADHNILWFGEELAGEEGFESSISSSRVSSPNQASRAAI